MKEIQAFIVDENGNGVRKSVNGEEHRALIGAAYEQFRVECTSPSGTQDVSLYVKQYDGGPDLFRFAQAAAAALYAPDVERYRVFRMADGSQVLP